jgi:hypothetical protein
MLQSRRSINIMQFFSFINNCFDVEAFQQSDFTNNFSKRLLMLCEIIVRHMPNSFKAVRKWYVSLFFLSFVSEPFENFLIFTIFIVQVYWNLFNLYFVSAFFRNIFHFEWSIHKDDLFVWINSNDRLIALLKDKYFGSSRILPVFFINLWKKSVSLLLVFNPFTFLVYLNWRIFSWIY